MTDYVVVLGAAAVFVLGTVFYLFFRPKQSKSLMRSKYASIVLGAVGFMFATATVLLQTPFWGQVEIYGKVVDSKGKPVSGAEVTVGQDRAGASVTATDELGAFRIKAKRNDFVAVRVATPGYETVVYKFDARDASQRNLLIRIANPLDDIFDALESDDENVRRNARKELAAQDQAALPRIEKVLQDQTASYRLQLGALVALNQMQNVTVTPETRVSIESLYEKYREHDPILSSEAQKYLKSHPK